MAEFKTFSLGEAMQTGQKLALNNAAMQDVASGRQKASKTAVLRQQMIEGDPEAFAKLAGLDIDQAKKTMDALKVMDDDKKEAFKQQNDSIAKAGMWIMQGANEQEQRKRFDESVQHMENQGMDVKNYKGKFSPQLIQNSILQSRSIAQAIEASSSAGAKKGIDKDGNPVFFSQNPVSGDPTVLKDVRPSNYQVYGKGGKNGGAGRGGSRKASDSNAMAKAVGTAMGASWTEDDKGNLSFKFKTDLDAKKSVELTAKAEKIFSDNPRMLHREAVTQAMKQLNINEENPQDKKQSKEKKSIKDFLNAQRNNNG